MGPTRGAARHHAPSLRRVLASVLAGLALACGQPAAPEPLAVGTGPAACSPDRVQDLVFHGAVSGLLACQERSTDCFWRPPEFTMLMALIPLRVDGRPAELYISTGSGYAGPRLYRVSSRLAANQPQFGLDLPGLRHWQAVAGGEVVVVADDSTTVAGLVSGTLDGPSRFELSGRWSCRRSSSAEG